LDVNTEQKVRDLAYALDISVMLYMLYLINGNDIGGNVEDATRGTGTIDEKSQNLIDLQPSREKNKDEQDIREQKYSPLLSALARPSAHQSGFATSWYSWDPRYSD